MYGFSLHRNFVIIRLIALDFHSPLDSLKPQRILTSSEMRMIPSIKTSIAAMLALKLSMVTSIQVSYTADHGEDSRMIAYVGNWQACPSDEQVDAYSHLGELP